MQYSFKKHYYDPYDSLDVEWKARFLHDWLSVVEAACLSGYNRQYIIAYKDNILPEDYAALVKKIAWNHDIHKEYLSSAEIKQLASTSYDHKGKNIGLLTNYGGESSKKSRQTD